MSDAGQGDVPATTSSPTPSDAPASETAPAEAIAADAEAVTADAETSVTKSTPQSDVPAEIPVPEHSNILENVGMSGGSDETISSSPAIVSDERAAAVSQPKMESPATAIGGAYTALLSLRDKALEAIQFRRQARLEKIIALAEKKGTIANDDVEKLLRVSNATASRYLSTLVRDGKLKRLGLPHASRYSLPTGSNGAV